MVSRLWLTCLWLATLLAACEPRVDEPILRDQAETGASPSPSADSTGPKKPVPPPVKRCVSETPASAPRAIPSPNPNPECPEDPGPVPELTRGTVEFLGTASGTKSVPVEIADTDPERMRGLMYRTKLPEDEGMLFIFEHTRELSFWMRNTCLSLDMIFVAADGFIVGIEENTPTLSDESFSPGCPARYVIETNAGWARKNGVKAGMRVQFPKQP